MEIANLVRRKRAFENRWYIYEMISKNPGITIYDLSKIIGWTPGKIEYYIKKLVADEVINNSTEVVNGRVRKSYKAKKMKDLLNWDEMTFVKHPNKKD